MNKERLIILAMAIGVIVVTLALGTWGYEDEQLDEKEYCEKVRDGVWPDYNENYKELCVDQPKAE